MGAKGYPSDGFEECTGDVHHDQIQRQALAQRPSFKVVGARQTGDSATTESSALPPSAECFKKALKALRAYKLARPGRFEGVSLTGNSGHSTVETDKELAAPGVEK